MPLHGHRLRANGPTGLLAAPAAALLLLTSCRSTTGLPLPADAGRTGWTTVASLHHPRAAHAVVADDQAIYALAGTGADGAPVLEVERFDGSAWRDETSLPGAGLNAPAAVLLDGCIYVIGGFGTVTNVPSSQVEIYDIRSKAWREGTPLPGPRGGHAAAVLDGEIHVVGGGNSQSTLADHSVFSPSSNSWRTEAPLPRPLGSPAAAVLDGFLYVIGGRSGPDDFGTVSRWDARGHRWIDCPSIDPRGTAGAVDYRGTIVVFGGESQAEARVLDDALRFDPRTGVWIALPPMPTPRSFARTVRLHDALYVVGGSRVVQTSHAPLGTDVAERFDGGEPGCFMNWSDRALETASPIAVSDDRGGAECPRPGPLTRRRSPASRRGSGRRARR